MCEASSATTAMTAWIPKSVRNKPGRVWTHAGAITAAEVAAIHLAALDTEIRALRLRRAVVAAVVKRSADGEEMGMINKLARLSAAERRQIINPTVRTAIGPAQRRRSNVRMPRRCALTSLCAYCTCAKQNEKSRAPVKIAVVVPLQCARRVISRISRGARPVPR